MANRYTTLQRTITVAANGVERVSIDVGADHINVYRIAVVPTIIGGSHQLQVYDSGAFGNDNLVYGTQVLMGAYYDPVHVDAQGSVTNRVGLRAFLFPYDDADSGQELHIQIVNSDVQNKDFNITVVYENA